MIKITCVSAEAVKRIIDTFDGAKGISIIEEPGDYAGEEMCTIEIDAGLIKLYPLFSSVSIDFGGRIEILEKHEFRELRFC